MNIVIKHQEDLLSYIKSVFLKYCPYLEDRLSILNNSKSNELDIDININKNGSRIMFIFGNSSVKASISERAMTTHIIRFKEIGDIIDFILEDHEVIKNISLDSKRIDLKFAINWTDKSIKGFNCNDIGLNLNFENMEVKKQYLYLLFQRYYTHLEHLPIFKTMINEYMDNMKHSYFELLDKKELTALLNRMSENELRELLYLIDNDIFIKYVLGNGEQTKERVLSLKENNKST